MLIHQVWDMVINIIKHIIKVILDHEEVRKEGKYDYFIDLFYKLYITYIYI